MMIDWFQASSFECTGPHPMHPGRGRPFLPDDPQVAELNLLREVCFTGWTGQAGQPLRDEGEEDHARWNVIIDREVGVE